MTTYAVVRWRAKRPRITIYCRRCSARLIIYREHGKTVEVCGCGKGFTITFTAPAPAGGGVDWVATT